VFGMVETAYGNVWHHRWAGFKVSITLWCQGCAVELRSLLSLKIKEVARI
jgi:hypothetical protein